MVGSAAVWGPMFLLGILSLSNLVRRVTSLYIEHMLSNLMIPMFLYSGYLLYSVGVQTGEQADYLKLGAWLVVSMISFGTQTAYGTDAQYFLVDGKSKWADYSLVPSIFYLLNWVEHTERIYPSDSSYGYYY